MRNPMTATCDQVERDARLLGVFVPGGEPH
jgi:hypothetical protein